MLTLLYTKAYTTASPYLAGINIAPPEDSANDLLDIFFESTIWGIISFFIVIAGFGAAGWLVITGMLKLSKIEAKSAWSRILGGLLVGGLAFNFVIFGDFLSFFGNLWELFINSINAIVESFD